MFVPYLHFQGNCAEAMRHYADVFGATDVMMMRYADAPAGAFPEGMPPEGAERIMHASLSHAGGRLMASDFPPGMDGDPQQAVSISIPVDDVATGRAIFDKLADGGTVLMPFGETFWTEGFGMVKDRFGTHWMINGPEKSPPEG